MISKGRVYGKGSGMSSEVLAASGLKQCQQAQDQLEDTIGAVIKAEQQLRENAREVRSELQSCVSRQQEALRCREVWLLGQIELLEQVKTETLQQQLHQLHRLRGQFDVIAHQLQNSSSNDLNNQLTSCMEKLSSLSLTPEETPEMSFHADTRSLKQAITSFGTITAQLVEGMSSKSSTHLRPQVQSCPITAKKQQMAEPSSLSNWLLESRPANRCAPIGYQSSTDPQDWLLPQKESKQTSCPEMASMDFMKAWGQLRDLEAWLIQDHSPNRERSVSSCSSSFSIEKIDEMELAAEEEEELNDWLVTPPTAAMETMSDAERWQHVFKPFEESWSADDWLSPASRSIGNCSSCCQTISAVEIENLGQLKCLKTTPTSGTTSPTSPAAVSMPASLEMWLQKTSPTLQTCRANELCSAYSACVCEDNCGKEALSRWLLQQEDRDKNGVPKNTLPTAKNAPATPFHREQEQKVQAILEAWLHPRTGSTPSSSPLQAFTSSLSGWVAAEEEKASREENGSSLSLFQSPLETDLWLFPRKSPAPAAPPQEEEEEEEDKWLLRKRSQAQERLAVALPTMCDLFSCMKVGGDKEKWLHRSPVQM
ncbi:nuclear receptor coactivator 4 isoform X1 [Oreochromis niloticus]|uniref:nuclear receptor coactivator 4 isoform X1 n=2 Tax=Oreochromis niloticus TaxID=8128 RepID=UPI0003942146|nr:nuclear receptor coactivator 4 isoform X1 [Oreochromis niloticus]